MDSTQTGAASRRRRLERSSGLGSLFALIRERSFEYLSLGLACTVVVLIGWIGWRLFADTALTRHRFGFEFLTKSVWDVPHEIYGASTFIYGTLLASALALVIAVPLSIGAALFLTEVAPRWLATPVAFLIDLLAAVPSIIYGLWGLLVLCPFVLKHVSPFLVDHLGANPLFVGPARLNNVLVAGLILAIMITPIITAVSREVIKTVPPASREASVGLGATRWETIRRVILPEARSGITGAVILGLGRAIGETMAVVMVIGNTPQIKASLVQPGYTMPALLANEFNEAFNVPLQLSALLEVALILFVVTLIVNASAQLLLTLTKQHITGKTERFPALSDFARNGMDLLGRYAFSVIVIGLLGLQVVSDFRAYGPGALGRGFEIMLVAAVLVTAFVRFLSSKAPMVKWRSVVDKLMRWTLSVSAFVACFAFGTLLVYVAMRGAHGINLDLFTKLPTPAGVPGGGLKSAILGTLELVLIASAIGIPAGLLSGVFVAEFHWHRLGALVRFAADVLNGIPSVVIGLFAYAAFVLPFGHFSAWAGGAALAIMMVPTVARTTEEILKLVPSSYREASAGLGAKKVQTIVKVVIPAAKSGIISGIMLAIARIAGETAPLLFTAFGNDHVVTNPSQPISSLTLKIYVYAISPYQDWVQQAWAGALVLLAMVFVFGLIARFATRAAPVTR